MWRAAGAPLGQAGAGAQPGAAAGRGHGSDPKGIGGVAMRKRGFTLVELLVVIVIITLLMALLFPSLRGVWKRYNMTRCQSNLFHISQALAVIKANEMKGSADPWLVSSWPAFLLPYVEGRGETFLCPEAEAVDWDPELGPNAPLQVHYVPARPWYSELREGPWTLRQSQTQYDSLKAQGYMRNRATVPVGLRGYKPDANPDVYWYCMEAWQQASGSNPSDQDFQDFQIRVSHTKDGKTELKFTIGGLGAYGQLCDAEGNVLIDRITNGATYVYQGDIYGESNYGLNQWVADQAPAGERIVALDYYRLVAKDTDDWSDPQVLPEGFDVPIFARHFGQVNVLFADGAVRPVDPQAIDPLDPSVVRRFW
jgi:prepilin-type N-terminal cleavage/methylation domain-containing protein/prepilin-type processing-associated H-X9-DG protein